jgi:hypothetical protein
MMFGGADVSANTYAHYGLGGQKLTDQQVAEINEEQQQEQLENFRSKSLYARIFDTSDSMALVSRVALAMPAPNSLTTSIMSVIQNPFLYLNNMLGTIFSGPRARAAVQAEPDPFSVTHYGYPVGSTDLDVDPETLDDTACKAQISAWEDSASTPEDSTSGEDENNTTAPCKLDAAVIAGLGGIYDSSLIDEDGL